MFVCLWQNQKYGYRAPFTDGLKEFSREYIWRCKRG